MVLFTGVELDGGPHYGSRLVAYSLSVTLGTF